MNNKIVYVTKNEAKLIKTHAIQNREVYFAEIDGVELRLKRTMYGRWLMLLLSHTIYLK